MTHHVLPFSCPGLPGTICAFAAHIEGVNGIASAIMEGLG
jgi:hypothetical protein